MWGFEVLGVAIRGLKFKVWGLGFGVYGVSRFEASGSRFHGQGFAFGVRVFRGFGFEVQGSRL